MYGSFGRFGSVEYEPYGMKFEPNTTGAPFTPLVYVAAPRLFGLNLISVFAPNPRWSLGEPPVTLTSPFSEAAQRMSSRAASNAWLPSLPSTQPSPTVCVGTFEPGCVHA